MELPGSKPAPTVALTPNRNSLLAYAGYVEPELAAKSDTRHGFAVCMGLDSHPGGDLYGEW